MSRFRRRLMGLAALRQAAADDFVRVEYIENISNAYIDTLYKPNNNTRIEAEFSFNRFDNTYSQFLFGARTSISSNKFYIINDSNTQYLNWHYRTNNSRGNVDIQINEKWKVSNNGGTLTYTNGTNTYTLSVANGSFSCPHSITIFAINNNGVPTLGTNSFNGRFYSFKIYDGTTLVRDYIPMYQISKDTYGLWDRVNEEFYTSPNGLKFTGGERVIADDDDNIYYLKNYIYINSTQTQYIILKPFTENDNVELKVHPIGATNYWFGDRSASGNQRRFQIASWNNTRLDIARNQFPSITYSKGIINKDITLKLDGKQFYVNNELLYTFTSNLSTTNNTNLGRVYNTGRATNSRFYWFKWWNSNKDLVYDLIPVQRCSDGVWGFFDKVSLVFHPSDGTAQFTGG